MQFFARFAPALQAAIRRSQHDWSAGNLEHQGNSDVLWSRLVICVGGTGNEQCRATAQHGCGLIGMIKSSVDNGADKLYIIDVRNEPSDP